MSIIPSSAPETSKFLDNLLLPMCLVLLLPACLICCSLNHLILPPVQDWIYCIYTDACVFIWLFLLYKAALFEKPRLVCSPFYMSPSSASPYTKFVYCFELIRYYQFTYFIYNGLGLGHWTFPFYEIWLLILESLLKLILLVSLSDFG